MALLECNDLSFSYEGNVVIKDLNFSVERGDYLCVLGENGSGKSTLMKGLLKLKQPQSGTIMMGDGLKTNEIGYLPQQTAAQKDFPASVEEVVLSGRLSSLGLRPFYSRLDRDEAKKNMERLGVYSLRKKCYRELSGGQQQRVLLARALCATKTMLLLDEPVAGLDPKVTLELYQLIHDINQDFGITIIMISHDLQSALKYANKVLHVKNSQLFFGSVKEYLARQSQTGFWGGAVND